MSLRHRCYTERAAQMSSTTPSPVITSHNTCGQLSGLEFPASGWILASCDTAHDALSLSHLGSVARLIKIALSFCRNLAIDLLRLANGQKGWRLLPDSAKYTSK